MDSKTVTIMAQSFISLVLAEAIVVNAFVVTLGLFVASERDYTLNHQK